MNPDVSPFDLPEDRAEIFDAEWEEQARRLVGQTGYDPDLAIRAARDSLLVLNGDLTEEELERRHHDGYLAAFGSDDRPRNVFNLGASEDEETDEEPAGEPDGAAAAHPARGGAFSRRTALQFGGAGAVAFFIGQMFSGLSRKAGAEGGDDPHAGHGGKGPSGSAPVNGKKPRMQMGMVIDLEKCDGCLFCVSGCKRDNGLPDGVHWIYVLAYEEPDRPNEVNLLPRLCNHCSNAPCVKVCPVTARHRREDGLVLTDYDKCIGCRYCQVSCPYGVNYFQWADSSQYGGGFTGQRKDARGRSVIGDPPRGVMGKCTFCPGRQDSPQMHGTTACVLACPHDVLHIGDLNDPESEPNRYLARRREENGGRLQTFRLLDDIGTKPNVIYIGNPPSRRAKEVPGPVSYSEWGLIQNRRAVLEGPEPWFKRLLRRL
jgi:Fe-S-cluster-containing dehydrogenase component